MKHEPAVIIGVIEAALILAVAFGAPITPEQKAAVLGFASAAIMVIGSVVIRSQVSSPATVEGLEDAAFARGER